MSHRRPSARPLLAVLVALGLLVLPPADTSAQAAPLAFSCMPASGLMGLNTPEGVLAGKVVLPQGVTVSIGTTGDVNWSQPQLDTESARLFYSLKWLDPLTREAARGRSTIHLERAQAIARDFARDNPPGRGSRPLDVWNPMYSGQRATVYSCLDSLGDDPAIRTALAAHGSWLADPVNDPGNWNQAIDPALGLLGAGCRLDRAEWRRQAGDRLGRLIAVNIDHQGAINEQAPGYGGFIYDRWGIVADKLTECGQPVPSAIAARRPLLLDFVAWATGPDGRFVQIGDTYHEPPRVVAGSPTAYVTSAGREGRAPSGTHKVYDAGYVFGRDTWKPFATGMHYSLRFGPGMDFHGHEDHQSVTLAASGRPVLVDSGHVGYTDRAKRDHLRSPEAHNVLVARGETLRRRQPTQLVRSRGGSTWQFFEVHDRIWGGHDRTRGMLADTSLQALLIQDRAARGSTGWFDQLWHLPRGSQVRVEGRGRAVARHPSGALETHVLQIPLPGQTLPAGSTDVITGRTDPMLGWLAPSVGAWHAAPVVRTSRSGTSTRMVTAVVPVPTGTAVSASVTAVGSHLQVTLTAGGTVRRYGLGNDGNMWLIESAVAQPQLQPTTVPDERTTVSLDAACPPGTFAPATFTDLGRTPFAADIACAVDWGVINGISAREFAPTRTVTRAQLASMLDRLVTASGHPRTAATTKRFTDVPAGNVHAEAIGRMAAAGIVAGRTDGSFDPAGAVTRGQLATMLTRLHEQVWNGALPATTARLPDVPVGSAHARGAGAMAHLEVMPVIRSSQGDFVPGAAVTRAQLTSHLMMLADHGIRHADARRP
ncbi:S-layer homology domain-containing protein [Egicoccus sp. AB-alg6-2]|uniref:S-layer homology domain-containing protein n=1 Tax=Egicoccus sp. AB-alg6-2 TaxID=3242692 RepID=UPI00359D02F4